MCYVDSVNIVRVGTVCDGSFGVSTVRASTVNVSSVRLSMVRVCNFGGVVVL